MNRCKFKNKLIRWYLLQGKKIKPTTKELNNKVETAFVYYKNVGIQRMFESKTRMSRDSRLAYSRIVNKYS